MFQGDLKDYHILIIYKFIYNKKIIVKLVLESLLIIILFFIIYIITVAKGREKKIITSDKSTKKRQNNIKKSRVTKKSKSATEDFKQTTTGNIPPKKDSINKQVFELFKKLYTLYNTDSISLYTHTVENRYSKSYELKGKSFLKIDSKGFDLIDLSGMINQLSSKIPVLQKNNNRLIIPIVDSNNLIAAIFLTSQNLENNSQIQTLNEIVDSITKPIKNYILLNNIMIDESTNLFSEAYLSMKLTELQADKQENNTDFSVIVLQTLQTTSKLDNEKYNSILKITIQSLSDFLPKNCMSFRDNDLIVILYRNSSSIDAMQLSSKIIETLKNIQIKLNHKETIKLLPYIGIACSSDYPQEIILPKSKNNLKIALERDIPNIQG